MKRAFLIFSIFIFMQIVSAANFDNVGIYDEATNTMTIKDNYGFGNVLANVTLLSPHTVEIMKGENRLVAWYKIENFEKNGNVFGAIDTYDLKKNGKPRKVKDITYKEEDPTTTQINQLPVCEWICVEQSCDCNVTRIEKQIIYGWKDFNEHSTLNIGTYTIGLFTDVEPEESIEWIPTIYGVNIPQWAIWNETFDVSLIHYYKFDEYSGTTAKDEKGTNNITVNSGSFQQGGIIYNMLNASSSGELAAQTQANMDTSLNNDKNRTFNFWAYPNELINTNMITLLFYGGQDNEQFGSIREPKAGNRNWSMTSGGVGHTWYTTDITKEREWRMHTLVYNGTTIKYYINGTLKGVGPQVLSTTVNGHLFLGSNATAITTYFNGSMDELGIWNRTLSDGEILSLYNSGHGLPFGITNITVVLDHPSNNQNTVRGTNYFNAYYSFYGPGNFTNTTLYIWGSDKNIYLLNRTSVTGSLTNSSNLSAYLPSNNYQWNYYVCGTNSSNNAFCKFANSNRTLIVKPFLENSQTFVTPAFSGTIQNFLINITYDSTYYTAINSRLFYNNTYYSPVQYGSGNDIVFNATFVIPTIKSEVNKTFYWEFIFTNATSTENFNSTSQNQTIDVLSIDNCTTNSIRILNFTLFDEDDRIQLNGTIELTITFYSSGIPSSSFNTSYSYVAGKPSLGICINSTSPDLTMDYHARYYSNVSFYPVEHKFAQSLVVSNITRSVDLYDLLDARSTAFQITLQSASLDIISGAIIDIQREYVPIDQFISVESPLTDDTGNTIGHFVSEEIYYNFIVTKNGVLLGTFNKQLVKCQNAVTGDCRISLNLIGASANAPDFQNYGNISLNYLWSPSTRTLLTTWISSDTQAHLVAQNVTLFDSLGNNTICTNSVTGLSGSFTCTVPNSYGNTTILSQMYSDNLYLGFSSFNLGDTANEIFGGTKVIIGILMYTTLTLMMIANPITIVIGSILGMGFAMVFHVVDGGSFIGNSSIILWFVIAGGIIIYHLSRRNY